MIHLKFPVDKSSKISNVFPMGHSFSLPAITVSLQHEVNQKGLKKFRNTIGCHGGQAIFMLD
jgi:hypothetical protein